VSACIRRFAARADAIMLRIQPILAGHGPELQGAVINDLTAIWIAGHRVSDPAEERRLHEELLALHCEHVREMVKMYVSERE
jgi:hypothetical protein